MLVATKDEDVSPGPPYYSKIKTTGLYLTPIRYHGLRYYLQAISHGCSRTWLTDTNAEKWLEEATVV